MQQKKVVMDADGIDRSLTRIAYEILEKNKGTEELCLVGIRTGGVFLAERLKKKLTSIEGVDLPVGILDITLYRDDLRLANKKPMLGKTDIPFSLDNRKVVLVDDFVGMNLPSSLWESVVVKLMEKNGVDEVVIEDDNQ